MSTVYLIELDEEKGELPMEKAIGKMRDEVTGVAMARHRGSSRELAMVMTKLDEARLWAEEYARVNGRLVTVDRERLFRDIADTTDTTDAKEVRA